MVPAAKPLPFPPEIAKRGVMTYADVSRGIQRIFKERQEPLTLAALEETFTMRFGASIPEISGVSTEEYLRRKENVFEYDHEQDRVFLQPSILAGPPIADPNLPKDESFVVEEFVQLIEDSGPVCYISALCGKFIQRNGVSVTSITKLRPLDLFKRHGDRFLLVGGGNVTLVRYKDRPDVQSLLTRGHAKAPRVQRQLVDPNVPMPAVLTEQDVVEEFKRLIQQDTSESVYISSLCGRFLQRFKKPVTAVINSRPADFLRKYPDIFEMVGGGNVRLRDPGAVNSERRAAEQEHPLAGGAVAVEDVDSVPALSAGSAWEAPVQGDFDPFVALDDQILGAILNEVAPPNLQPSVWARVQELAVLLDTSSFLCITEIVMAGPAGMGLTSLGGCEAELILVVDKLPFADHAMWLPHILETLLAVVEMSLGKRARAFRTDGRAVTFTLNGQGRTPSVDVQVTLTLAPHFASREHFSECMRMEMPPCTRRFYLPARTSDVIELIVRQPPTTQAAIKMLRWWVSRQPWSAPQKKPPQLSLELLVIYATLQMQRPTIGLLELLEHMMTLLGSMPGLQVTWEGTGIAMYTGSEIWRPLLWQRPLIMDPTTPFVNIVDPSLFDCEELACFARERSLQCFQAVASLCRSKAVAACAGEAHLQIGATGPPECDLRNF